MKRLSYPPMIVFLDVLFVFLFLLILNNNNKVIDIKLPPGDLFDGAKIVYKKFDTYYTLDKKEYIFDRAFTHIGKCSSDITECKKNSLQYGEDVFIVYPSKLQESISNLSLIALANQTCKNIEFIVNKEGKLEYEEMFNLNPCLGKIKNYKDFYIKG